MFSSIEHNYWGILSEYTTAYLPEVFTLAALNSPSKHLLPYLSINKKQIELFSINFFHRVKMNFFSLLVLLQIAIAYPMGNAPCDGGRRMTCKWCGESCGQQRCRPVNFKLEKYRNRYILFCWNSSETRQFLITELFFNLINNTNVHYKQIEF